MTAAYKSWKQSKHIGVRYVEIDLRLGSIDNNDWTDVGWDLWWIEACDFRRQLKLASLVLLFLFFHGEMPSLVNANETNYLDMELIVVYKRNTTLTVGWKNRHIASTELIYELYYYLINTIGRVAMDAIQTSTSAFRPILLKGVFLCEL